MRLLVIGSDGQVAKALRDIAPVRGVALYAIGRPTIDLRDKNTIRNSIDRIQPDIIVNAAAYTAVDCAEINQAEAYAINAIGAGHVAEFAAKAGLPLIQLSTDCVFDGKKGSPYRETDQAKPLNVYGSSKLAGEELVASQNSKHVILRTSWIYYHTGDNFVRTMLSLAGSEMSLRVVDDQYGAPTYAADIAAAILVIAVAINDGRGQWGTFHAAASGATTWCGLANATFKFSKTLNGPFADVQAITTAQHPTLANRPLDTRLDCARLAASYGLILPDWRDGLDKCLNAIAAGKWRLM